MLQRVFLAMKSDAVSAYSDLLLGAMSHLLRLEPGLLGVMMKIIVCRTRVYDQRATCAALETAGLLLSQLKLEGGLEKLADHSAFAEWRILVHALNLLLRGP